MGAKSLVVLDCGVFGLRDNAPRSIADVLTQTLAVMMRQQVAADVPLVGRDIPVLYLPGPFPLTSSPLAFEKTPNLIIDAYRKSRGFLQAVEIDGPGVYCDPGDAARFAPH